MRTTTVLLFLSVTLGGCVSTGRYDELNAKYSAQRKELADRNGRVRALEQALAEQEAEAQRLAAQIEAPALDRHVADAARGDRQAVQRSG